MKKTLYKIHKLAGLILGIFISLLALSGVLITFREELLPVVYPDFKVTNAGEELHPSTLLRNAQIYLKDRKLTNFYANGAADEAALILFKDQDKSLPGILVMNPYSGKVISEMPLWQNLFAVSLYFHANFFLGKTGEWMVGILGLVLVFFVISGLIIWLPKKNFFLKFRKTFTETGIQKLHHQLGLILAIPLFISALTGFLIIFDLGYAGMKAINNDPTRPEELSSIRECSFENDLSALSVLSELQLKNLISIHLCGKKNAFMRVSIGTQGRHPSDGYSRILIDSQTKTIVQNFDSDRDPKSWNVKRLFFYPIHSGEFFGMAGKIIVFLTGLGLMAIFVTGILLTINRSKRPAHTQQSNKEIV